PNIVNVYTFDRDGDVFFMTMELLEGRTLKERIDTDCRLGMPFDDAWPIIEGAGRALAYAHQHAVVHSDLKPSNIFVTREGQAKVLDFGIARAIGGGGPGSTRFDAQSLGALTPGYASCEMLEGKPPDPRDDVYSFACVVYELLTGRHPFAQAPAVLARDSKLKVRPIEGLSRKRNAAIERALAFDRDKRTPSIERFLKDLAPPAPMTRARMAAYAAAAVGVVAIGGAFFWLAGGIETTEEADRAFVQRLMQARDERSPDYDAELVDLLLEQGTDYLTQARARFDPAILSEGVTTAHYAFTKALEMDPQNQRAAEGVLEVLRMYRQRAQEAASQGRHREALELADIGLRINPESRELRRLRASLLEKLAAEPAQ
ncbi:MAG TPA: protein kinase, partial [Steroidobacteraceae bacterium]